MDRSNIGLAGKVKKKYTGIDLDNDREVVNAMYGDISTVEGSLEYLKNYAESLGYEVEEVWRKGRYKNPEKRANLVELLKNPASDVEDDYTLKNFVVRVYFHSKWVNLRDKRQVRILNSIAFGIGFSYFTPFYKNKRPNWWWTGSGLEIDKDIEEKYGEGNVYSSNIPLTPEFIPFVFSMIDKYRAIPSLEESVSSLGLSTKVKREFEKKDPVDDISDEFFNLKTIEEAKDFIKAYAKAHGYSGSIYETADEEIVDIKKPDTVWIQESWHYQECSLIIVTHKLKFNGGKGHKVHRKIYKDIRENPRYETVSVTFGHMFRKKATPSSEDWLDYWNLTGNGRITENLTVSVIISLFKMAKDMNTDADTFVELRESTTSLGLGNKLKKTYFKRTTEDSVKDMQVDYLKNKYLEHLSTALYGTDDNHVNTFGFICDDASAKEYEGVTYPGCLLFPFRDGTWSFTSNLLANPLGDQYFYCIEVFCFNATALSIVNITITKDDLSSEQYDEIENNMDIVLQ